MSLKTKPAKRLIGYARVSTQQQDLARQTKALKRLGCAVIYSDTASGKSMAGRPQLACALDDLDTGSDCIGTSHGQGAAWLTQREILPQPPLRENKALTWPNWPLKLRTSSSQEEGAAREFSVLTTEVIGENGV